MVSGKKPTPSVLKTPQAPKTTCKAHSKKQAQADNNADLDPAIHISWEKDFTHGEHLINWQSQNHYC